MSRGAGGGEPVKPWWERRMIALDLETTDSEPELARIVTASIAEVGGGQPTGRAEWLADPGVPISEEAARIHGITTEVAQAKGRPVKDVVEEVLAVLAARPQGTPLVIFNAPYDLTVLDREARRHGLTPLGDRGELLAVDPFVIDAFLDMFRKGRRTLSALCEWYRCPITPEEAHQSASDAVAAARLAFQLGKKAQVVREIRTWHRDPSVPEADRIELESLTAQWEAARVDLPRLHAAQQRWHAARQAGRRDYWQGKGDERWRTVTTDNWPFAPYTVPAAA